MATIMHDICKGRGGDHSEVGAGVGLEVCAGLGMTAEETETVSWLVLHHLLLSATAFKRDIDDPKTILDLAETIQSPERLRLLLILTVADMRAVSSKVWNGWKATLLRELYARVAEVLAGGLSTPEPDVGGQRAKPAACGLALDTCWIQDAAGGTFDQPHRLAKLSALIEQALSGGLRLTQEILKLSRDTFGKRMRAIHAPPRVVVDNHASNMHTILEVN